MLEYGVLGASLSGQTVRHDSGEPVGYVEFLRRNHAAQLNTTPDGIRAHAYAGARMCNAGLVRLQDVLIASPDICVIEPLVEDTSKGRWARPVEIQTIYKRLIEAGILPVTFLVGLPEHVAVDEFPVTAFIRRTCRLLDLPVIEADIAAIKASGAEFSGVHTTQDSGTLLAAQLADGLAALDVPTLRARAMARTLPQAEMQVNCVPLLDMSDLRRFSLDIIPDAPGPYSLRVVLEQSIGPQAPVIRARVRALEDGTGLKQPQEISVWDQHCYYDRDAFTTLLEETGPFTRPIRVEIEVIDTDPDYARARRIREEWPTAGQRCLRPRGPVAVISDQPVTASVPGVTPLGQTPPAPISARDNPEPACKRRRIADLSWLRRVFLRSRADRP